MLANDPVAQLRTRLTEAVEDDTLAPADRINVISEARDEILELLDAADSALADAELLREVEHLNAGAEISLARENADYVDEMVRRGISTVEALEAVGFLSHDALDEAAENGRLAEAALGGISKAFGLGLLKGTAFNAKVRRGVGGKFQDKPGAPKVVHARGGGKIKSVVPETPHAARHQADGGLTHPAKLKAEVATEPGVTPNGRFDIVPVTPDQEGGGMTRKLKGKRGPVKKRTYPVFKTPTPHDPEKSQPERAQGDRATDMSTAQRAADHSARGVSPDSLRGAGKQRLMRLEKEARRRAAKSKDPKERAKLTAKADEIAKTLANDHDVQAAGKAEKFDTTAKSLDKRVSRAVKKAERKGKLDPAKGKTEYAEDPIHTNLSQAEVHLNAAGRVSQRTLLHFAEEESTQPTTVDKYRNPDGSYVPSRQALHDRIIDMMLRRRDDIDGRPGPPSATNDYYATQDEPTVVFTGGGYAAGKGSVQAALRARDEFPPDAMVLDPDEIKALLPEFQDQIGDNAEANLLCHDEETETLTDRGWLGLTELRKLWDEGESFRVAVFDMETGATRMEVPLDMSVYQSEGAPIYHFKHQSTDLRVTGDHRMVTQRKHREDWEIVRARDLEFHADGRSAAYVPGVAVMEGVRVEEFALPAVWKYQAAKRLAGAGRWTGMRERAQWPERTVPMDAFLRYLGWWLAEGDKTGAVCQSPDSPFLEDVQQACREFWPEATEDEGRMWVWRPTGAARQLRDWLAANCGTGAARKRVPDFVFDLAPEQRMLVLRGLVHGDGACGSRLWDGSRSVTFSSLSERLADDAQRLAISCGLRASARRYAGRPDKVVQMSRPKTMRRRLPEPLVEAYDGLVYCFTMPSSTMVTRRAGFVSITGNCYQEAWDIAQALQEKAKERRINVVVDGICNTSACEVAGRVDGFKQAGYKDPRLVYVSVATNEAIRRARARAEGAKKDSDRRFIPEVIMRAVHRDVSSMLPEVMANAGSMGATVEVWDTEVGQDEMPILTAISKPDGAAPDILHQDRLQNILNKANEGIPGVDKQREGDVALPEGDIHSEVDPEIERKFGEALAGILEGASDGTPKEPQPVTDVDELVRLGTEKGLPEFRDLSDTLAKHLGVGVVDFSSPDAPGFKEAGASIRNENKGAVVIGPVKRAERIKQKIAADGQGDATGISDVVRGTVLMPDTESLGKALEALTQDVESRPGWKIDLVKNRLADSSGGRRFDTNGYGDIMLIIRSPTMSFEMQVNTIPLWYEKELGEGHRLYESERRILEPAKAEGRDLTSDEYKRLRMIWSKAKPTYDAAFQHSIQSVARSTAGAAA